MSTNTTRFMLQIHLPVFSSPSNSAQAYITMMSNLKVIHSHADILTSAEAHKICYVWLSHLRTITSNQPSVLVIYVLVTR